jgi:FkbM family methyltransferase
VNRVTTRLANALGSRRFSVLNHLAKGTIQRATGNELTAKMDGLVLTGPVESWTVLSQFANNALEPYEAQLFKALLRPGMRVIDVGANLGYYTLLAARAVGPTGVVHAFEPDPRTAPYLRRNIDRNQMTNVRIVQAAASDRHGQALFRESATASHSGLHRTMDDAAPVKVNVVTTRIDDCDVGPIDLVKMDVEGEEPAALRGMSKTIASSPALRLFVEFSPQALTAAGNDPRAFVGWITSTFELVASIDERRRAVSRLSQVPQRRLNLFCSRVSGDEAMLVPGSQ